MPRSRRGYNIGAGLAAGAGSFVNAYMQASQMKQQEKLQQNAFLVQVLTKQLEDENMPLYQRAKILDSIPPLIGIKKMDRRLSEMLGMDEVLLNEEVETGQIREGTPATKDRDLVDENVTDPSMASSIRLKGTKATEDEPILRKRGELTPALIRKKLILEAKKAEDVQDIDKQTKLLKINYDLQKESLKGEGFTKEVFRGYDKNGNYIVTLTNQKGERKDIFLGDVDPDAIVKARINSGNKPSKFLQERELYWMTQTNPATGLNYSEDEANIKALEDANKQFQLKQRTGEAYIEGVTQRNEGTIKVTPAQKIDDTRALAERKSILRANLATIKRQAADASIDARQKSQQATDHWNNVIEPIKNEMQKWLDDGNETTDPEYTRQQARLNTEINRFNELKRAADDAVSRDKSLKDSVKESENILNSFEQEIGVTSTSPSIPANIKAAINTVRKNNKGINNPSSPTYLSDEQIINYLISKGKIK